MQREYNTQCPVCNNAFTIVGNGNQVNCPYCSALLTIGGSSNHETDYYDEDMEGADGYYGFD